MLFLIIFCWNFIILSIIYNIHLLLDACYLSHNNICTQQYSQLEFKCPTLGNALKNRKNMISIIDNLQGAVDVSDINIKHIYYKDHIVVMLTDTYIEVCDLSQFDTDTGTIKSGRIERTTINDFCLNETNNILYISDHRTIYQINLVFDDSVQGQYTKLFTTAELAVEEYPEQAYRLLQLRNLIVMYTYYNFIILRDLQIIGSYTAPHGILMKISALEQHIFILLESGQVLLYDLQSNNVKNCSQINVNYIDFGLQRGIQPTLLYSEGIYTFVVNQQVLFLYRLENGLLKTVFECPNKLFQQGIIVDELSSITQIDAELQNQQHYFLLHCIQLDSNQMVQSEIIQYVSLTNITIENLFGDIVDAFHVEQLKNNYGSLYLNTELPKMKMCQFEQHGNFLFIIQYNNQNILVITQFYMSKDDEEVNNDDYMYPLVFNNLVQLNFGPEDEIQEAYNNNPNPSAKQKGKDGKSINYNPNNCFIDKESNEIIQLQQIFLDKTHVLNLRSDKIVVRLRAQMEKKRAERKNDKPTMFRPQDYIKSNLNSQLKLCDFLTKKHNKACKTFNQYEEMRLQPVQKTNHKTLTFAQKHKNKQMKPIQSLNTDQQIVESINIGKQIFISQTSQNNLQVYSTNKETVTIKKQQDQQVQKKQSPGSGKKQFLHFKNNFCFQQQVQTYSLDHAGLFLAVSVNQGYQLHDMTLKTPILQQVKHNNQKYQEKVLKNHQPTFVSFIRNDFNYRSTNILKQRYTERFVISNLLNDLYLDYFCYDSEDTYKQVQINNIGKWTFQESIWSGASFTNTFSPHAFLCIGSSISGFDIVRGKIAFQYNVQGTQGVAAKGIKLALPDFYCCDQKFFAAYGQIGDRHAAGSSYEKQIFIFDIRVKDPVRTFIFSQNVKSVAFKNGIDFYALGKSSLYQCNIQYHHQTEVAVFEKPDLFNAVQTFYCSDTELTGAVVFGKEIRLYT